MRVIPLALWIAAGAAAQDPDLRLVRFATGMPNAIDIQHAGDRSGRLFIALQTGSIWILQDGRELPAPLLDLGSKTRARDECGLLGLAFPPGFREKQYFYVHYTDAQCRTSIVSRYRMRDRDAADPDSESVILRQAQPFANHNGGQLAFGRDGYLYIGFGDGGSGGDPQGNGQNRRTWLGKILRIDTESGGEPYRVPPTNPFVGNSAYAPEIWALGLRNPWRFSFDRETGDLWIGDVGQNRAEEIDFQPASSKGGENYGWAVMEGMRCYAAANCDRTGLTLPVVEYTRERGDISVTGGVVLRGRAAGSLRGVYVYGDFASGRLWGIRRQGTQFVNTLLADTQFNITAFGEDEAGEAYLADYSGGNIHRIEAPDRPRILADSLEPGLVPGSLVTLAAANITSGPVATESLPPLPSVLAGVRVSVAGREVPIASVINDKVAFQVPWELAGESATVIVSRDGIASLPITVPVAAAQPGILAVSDPPLRRGTVATLWATGLGPVDNTPATGSGAPSDPLARVRANVEVRLGGISGEVSFAGLAPTLAGVYVVNFTVPEQAPDGDSTVTIEVSGRASKPFPVAVQ